MRASPLARSRRRTGTTSRRAARDCWSAAHAIPLSGLTPRLHRRAQSTYRRAAALVGPRGAFAGSARSGGCAAVDLREARAETELDRPKGGRSAEPDAGHRLHTSINAAEGKKMRKLAVVVGLVLLVFAVTGVASAARTQQVTFDISESFTDEFLSDQCGVEVVVTYFGALEGHAALQPGGSRGERNRPEPSSRITYSSPDTVGRSRSHTPCRRTGTMAQGPRSDRR